MNKKSKQTEMQKKLLLPREEEIQKRLFEKEPVRAIAAFLGCYNSSGEQFFEFPEHLIEFLKNRFQAFMNGDYKSLNDAFGKRTARQRNSIQREPKDYDCVFDLIIALGEARRMSPRERSGSTPFEFSVAQIAEKYGKSEDSIRDIYKKSK